PGPVFLPFPAAEGAKPAPPPPNPGGVQDPPRIGGRGGSALLPAAARERLAASRRPLIMAGIGLAAAPGRAEALRGVAESGGCPVIVTSQIKGYFPEDHGLFAGA